jgi:hypothetical protein
MTLILGSYEMKGLAGREGHQTCVQFLCVNHQAVTLSSTIFTSIRQLNHKKMTKKMRKINVTNVTAKSHQSPEMEFLNHAFLFEVMGKNSILLRLKFLSGFLPSFSVLQNAIHE